jgi:recombination protein RecA
MKKRLAQAQPFAVSLVKSLRTKLKLQKSDPTNVSLLSDEETLSEVTEFLPSGFDDIDRILGGGWPVGRASEVYGQEGVGKSALAQYALRSCQRVGGVPIYIDFETALDRDKMIGLDIDPDRLVYCSPADIEEAWDIIWTAIDQIEAKQQAGELDAPTLIVWDSVAASMPRAEGDEKSSAQSHVGLVARSMSKGCRKMFRRISQVRAHMMWINQERDKIGGFTGFGDNKQTTGGAAIRYAASLRVRCAKVETLKWLPGQRVSGYRIATITKKNRLAPPHQKSEWVLDFQAGPSPDLTLLDHLTSGKVVKSAGEGEYVVPWRKIAFSRGQWLGLMADPDFAALARMAHAGVIAKRASSVKPEDDASEESE